MQADAESRERTYEWYRQTAVEFADRSPSYGAMCAAVVDDEELMALVLGLPEPSRQPNLLFGAVRYHFGVPADFAQLKQWILSAPDRITQTMTTRRTQTNEPARCAAILPVLASLPQPLTLIEVGASAGLCLYPDRYHYDYLVAGGNHEVGPVSAVELTCRVTGDAPLPGRVPEVAGRIGIDLNPLDPADPDDVRWLEALIWPEETDRFPRLRAAAAIAAADPPTTVTGDLVDVLPEVIAGLPDGTTPVVFHTMVMPYLSNERRTDFSSVVEELGVRWISQEHVDVFASIADRLGPVPTIEDPMTSVVALDGVPVALGHAHGGRLDWLAGPGLQG